MGDDAHPPHGARAPGRPLIAHPRAGAHGTFLVNGNNYGCIYDTDKAALMRREIAEGHQVASHSWSHPVRGGVGGARGTPLRPTPPPQDLATLTSAQVAQQISFLDAALMKIVGLTPAFMRPPYGASLGGAHIA